MTQPELEARTATRRILLFAAEPAAEIAAGLGYQITVASDPRQCQEALGRIGFDLLLLEETFALDHAAAAETLYDLAGAALVLEINFGTASSERVLRQTRAALERRRLLEARTRSAVLASLRNELSASLSGLLLESQLALKMAGPEVAPSLQQVVSLAEGLSQQLRA